MDEPSETGHKPDPVRNEIFDNGLLSDYLVLRISGHSAEWK